MRMMAMAAAAVVGFAGLAGQAAAQDAANGEQVFARMCRSCHMIVSPEGETIVRGGQTGPNQWGVIGRTAGSQEDFPRYSDSMKAAGEAGLVWTAETVVPYLQDPTAFLRQHLNDEGARSNMAFKLRDEKDAADVAAYLAQFGG